MSVRLAFHHGDFDGSGTRAGAAREGRIFADTDPSEIPVQYGSITTPTTNASQTTYSWTRPPTIQDDLMDILVVAGGGASGVDVGGGGGAGGLLYQTLEVLSTQTVVVGNGGIVSDPAVNGTNSSVQPLGLTAIGGGGGARFSGGTQGLGRTGGSGGGASFNATFGQGTPGQGNAGGLSIMTNGEYRFYTSGGGGGAGGAAASGNNIKPDGGVGRNFSSIFGTDVGDDGWFAGGGGGGGGTDEIGLGGKGGGGDGVARGNNIDGPQGNKGQAHTGGGAGGHAGFSSTSGGSGIVLFRFTVIYDMRTPSAFSGLTGWFTGFSAEMNTTNTQLTRWRDLSGKGNHVESGAIRSGTISRSDRTNVSIYNDGTRINPRVGIVPFPFLYGSTGAGLRFPTTMMNDDSNYTLFHVARYYKPVGGAPVRRRIFDGVTSNWLSGFHGGRSGVAYHGSWLTPQIDLHGDNWLVSTDQNNMYRSNGIDRTSLNYSGGTSIQLSINDGAHAAHQSSDWACAEVIVYSRELTSAEYLSVEAYLTAKYFNYGRVPTTGVLSGSLLKATYYSGTEGVGGVAGYPISIGRLGQRIGNTYQTLLNISDFIFTLSSGLIRRRYSHSATVHPLTETQLTSLFNGATRTAGPTVVSDINTRIANDGDHYGMIWIGYIYIATGGTYTFGTNSDDASDMHINYARVTHAYGGHGVAANLVPFGSEQYTAYLKQGYYRFSYRFEEIGGGDGYQALWKTPGSTSWAVIPSSVFFYDSRDQITSSEPTDPTVRFP